MSVITQVVSFKLIQEARVLDGSHTTITTRRRAGPSRCIIVRFWIISILLALGASLSSIEAEVRARGTSKEEL